MQVDASPCGDIQDSLGQNQAIGHHDHQPGFERGQRGLLGFILQAVWLENRDVVLQGKLLDRAGLQLSAPPRRPVGLAVDTDNLVRTVQQRLQNRNRKIRGTGEDNTHSDDRFDVVFCGAFSITMARLLFQFFPDAVALQ